MGITHLIALMEYLRRGRMLLPVTASEMDVDLTAIPTIAIETAFPGGFKFEA